MNDITDDLIVEEVLSGNKEAYARLVIRYKKALYNLAFRMTSSAEDARDLSQEAFVRAYANLYKYKPDKSFFTWLYTICLNLTRNHLEKKSEVLTDRTEGFTPKDMNAADCNHSPEESIIEHQEMKWLEKALQTLPVSLREAVVLRYMQELSFGEVAQVLDIDLSAAKMRVYRGLEKMRIFITSQERTDES